MVQKKSTPKKAALQAGVPAEETVKKTVRKTAAKKTSDSAKPEPVVANAPIPVEPETKPAAKKKMTSRKVAEPEPIVKTTAPVDSEMKPAVKKKTTAKKVVESPSIEEPKPEAKVSKEIVSKSKVNEPMAVEPTSIEELPSEPTAAKKPATRKAKTPKQDAPRPKKVVVEDFIMEEAFSGIFPKKNTGIPLQRHIQNQTQPLVSEDDFRGNDAIPSAQGEAKVEVLDMHETSMKSGRKPRTRKAAKVDIDEFVSDQPQQNTTVDTPSETIEPAPKKKQGRRPGAKKLRKGIIDAPVEDTIPQSDASVLTEHEPGADELSEIPEEILDEIEAIKAKNKKPEEPKVLRDPRPREDRPANIYEVESVLDINNYNIWNLNEFMIAELWENERKETDFSQTEEKLLNIIRTAFDLVHYDEGNARDKRLYDNGDWAHFSHCRPGRGTIAIRRRLIRKLSDLTYENIRHITAPTLLELIDRNFGGGWDSISLSLKDIIESGFDISTTQLPASRMHTPGGTLDKKVAQGYDVLELARGTWIEAIFAKKKDPIEKLHYEAQQHMFDEDGNELLPEAPDEDEDIDDEDEDADGSEDNADDESYYSNYVAEADVKDEDEEGFPIVEAD